MKRAVIIVCGVEVEVPGDVRVVTFRDNPAWSFMAARKLNRESRFLYPRYDKDGHEVRELTKLKDVVHKVVLHSDVTRDAAACFRVLVQEGYSTHFCVDWDGTIYQTADPQYTAIHAGPANRSSIGIDMNNVLPNLARKGYSSVTYPTDIHPGIQDPESPFFRPKSRRMQINDIMTHSYGYADKQYESLMALLKALLKVIPSIKPYPPVDESGKIIPRVIDDFQSFSGIMAHWHISSTRWDPGPGFDWDRLIAGLSEEHNSFPFLFPDRKNIATLMARSKVEKRALRYYGNNEQGSGGYFPIGLYQNWHNGIHLHPPEGADVLNMMDGMLVAAHFSDNPTLLGSNNFVLLRHDAELPTVASSGKASRKTLKTYSLYMHLAPMPLEPSKDAPPWLRALYRGDVDEDADEQPDLDGDAKAQAAARAAREEADEEDRLDFERQKVDYPWLETGPGLFALKRGQIALFPIDQDRRIRIPANERIGRVGTFGEELDREALLHVEVFSDESWRTGIDMNKHGDFWVELEEDLQDDLVVDNEEILQIIAPRSRRLKGRRRSDAVLKQSEIEDFFGDPDSGAKSYLRRGIIRHISEWSTKVNWVRSLSKGQGWQALIDQMEDWTDEDGAFVSGFFTDEIRKVMPFIWLNDAVAEHIELDASEGLVYTFHPIYFLMWLTFRSAQRIQVLSSGKSARELKAAYKKEMARYAEQREKRLFDENAENITEGCIAWELDAVEASPKEVLEEIKRLRFPDQWRIMEDDDED